MELHHLKNNIHQGELFEYSSGAWPNTESY